MNLDDVRPDRALARRPGRAPGMRGMLRAVAVAGAVIALAQAMQAQGALAQAGGGTALSMGAMKVSDDLPVEVTSDELQVDQTANTATFKGNVIVVQGDMRLSSDAVLVEYGPSEEGGRSRIQKMTATGDVIMASPTESAEGRQAVYTVVDRTLVMTGDVVVTQGPSVITGERMTVHLDTGTAVMEGRVRTVIETGREPGRAAGGEASGGSGNGASGGAAQ